MLQTSDIPKDPILQMFDQTFQFKEICFDMINQQSSMEDLKAEFLEFYNKSIEQLEYFFSKGLKIKEDPHLPNTLKKPGFLNNSDKQILAETGNTKGGSKRNKLNDNDFVEKVLMDFGYQDDENLSKIVIDCKRKSLPITDERIVIKLKDPKAPLQRDLGPKPDFIRPTTAKKPKESSQSSGQKYPCISVTCSEDSNSNKENINDSNVKSDITFRNSNDFLVQSNTKNKNLLKPVQQKSNTKAFANLRSSFEQMNISKNKFANSKSKKKSNPLRKSLLPDFEVASRRESEIDEVKLPSEDKDCNKELEELLQTLTQKQKESKHKSAFLQKEKEVPTNTSNSHNVSTMENSTVGSSSLSNQIHNILYSKPANHFKDSDEEEEDDEYEPVPESAEERSDDEFKSFKDYEDSEEDDDDLESFRDIEYELTDYSDNSSSNNGSYSFHEEMESINDPPKMFQLFNNIQLNLKDPCSQCNDYNFEPSQGLFLNQKDSQTLNKGDFGLTARGSGDSNGSQTMFHDYQYYLKQQQPQNSIFDPNYDHQREIRLSKLNGSPTKMGNKVKRVYCNDKRVPLWAGDLKEVERISKEQKKIFNPFQVFGHFSVDNLNLVEVFNKNEPRFRQPRGSSANWKNEVCTPSTSKPYNLRGLNLGDMDLTNTKKAIEFKSGKSTDNKSKDKKKFK